MTKKTDILTLPQYAAKARGYLKIEERQKLFELARDVPDDGVILNIGIEYGASMICLRAGNKTAQLIGIDLNVTKLSLPNGFTLNAIITSGDSSQIVRDFADELDLIFIDGDHGYRGVTLDTQYLDWLLPDGVVMFHDCYDWIENDKPHRLVPGVMEAVDDWFKSVEKRDWTELDKVGTSRLFRKII